MDKINAVVNSESLSPFLSCYSNKDDKIIASRDCSKTFTNTKSRMLLHYNEDAICNQSAGPSSPTSPQHQSMKTDSSKELLRQTRYYLPFDVEKFRKHSNNEVSATDLRNNTRSERKIACKKDFSIGLSIKGSNEIDVLTNGYYRAIYEKSTSSGTTSPKEILYLRSDSFNRQNQGNENVDTPVKSNTMLKVNKCGAEEELLRAMKKNTLPNQSCDGQSCALKESKPPIEVQNETRSFTLNNQHRNSNIEFKLMKENLPNSWPNSSLQDKLTDGRTLNTSVKEIQTRSFTLHSNSNIDFVSMKQTLQNPSSPIKKFDLVQSLVLRLSNEAPDEGIDTVQAIVENDLFGLNGESGNRNTLEDLLWPVNITTPHPLQTSAAKLLNALVSFETGRDYFAKTSMVKLLTWSGSEQINDSMADNLIATLKKLSLSKFQRRDMLEKGLLQWLTKHMEMVEHSASVAHMECLTDLLRMLMNVENSTEFAFVNVPHLIVVLVRYLKVANEYVQINIGHVLRALFVNEAAIEIGNKINLHRIIRDLFEKASNSELKADFRFIYELFIKHRSQSSNQLLSSASNISRSTGSGKAISAGPSELSNDLHSPNEQLICEQNLMQESEITGGKNEIEAEDDDNLQLSVKPKQSIPSDLRSYIVQLCLDKTIGETGSKTSGDARNDQSSTIKSNLGAMVLYSNLDSRLEQSSSVLSGGSQCTSSACKESAIQTLKMQSTRTDLVTEMDQQTQNLSVTSSSNLQSQKVLTNSSSKALSDYSDLSSMLKDRDTRNEILENESFIDELCEKVFKKLRSKLAQNFFCGPNCSTNDNTNTNCGDCTKVETNV